MDFLTIVAIVVGIMVLAAIGFVARIAIAAAAVVIKLALVGVVAVACCLLLCSGSC